MKKHLILIFTILFFSNVFASVSLDSAYYMKSSNYIKENFSQEFFCDACGCAAGNGSSGFESLLNPQFIGIKFFAQHYKAKENLFTNDLTQDQYFNTLQIWGKIPITQKLSIYGSLPYHFHSKKTLQGDINIEGIGDASVMGIYQLLDKKEGTHQLNGGLGVKLPLGKFDEKGITAVNSSFQLGTGSWDYLFVLNYKYQKGLFSLLLNTDYTLKTENKKHYQFGNQWNYAATGFYRLWRNENSIFSGKLGFQGEVYNANQQFKEQLPNTAGSALYGKLGFELSYKKWSLGSEMMLPAYNKLANGDIKAKSRLGIFVNFGL